MKRVTGIGGVFFKASDPHALALWYEQHLGIGFGKNLYFSFSWKQIDKDSTPARTDLGIFSDNSDYFNPSSKKLMLNLRVENLENLLKMLREEGVTVVDKIDRYAYGNFGWIIDPEENKIELWQPIESGFGENENNIGERIKTMNRVTGIGGVFFIAKDNQKLMQWYDRHLDISFTGGASAFQWKHFDNDQKGSTVFSIFKDSTKYFEPSPKDFMINFRVNNLQSLLNELKNEGVQTTGEFEKYDYGNFGWILDPEGNKIELWEPVDEKL